MFESIVTLVAVETVFLDDDHHVAVLTMTSQRSMNPLSQRQFSAIAQAFEDVSELDSLRVVLLRSGVSHFSAGADLAERFASTQDEILEGRSHSLRATNAILGCPVPVIASVHGFTLGGGCELALLCDIVIASDDAVLGLPETAIGIVPGAGGTQLLARRAGLVIAADVLFSGRRLSASEALAFGVISRVVPGESLDTHARELAQQIALRAPEATRKAKAALYQGLDLPLRAGLAREDDAWRQAAMSPEYQEGLRSFSEKRPPRY